jgi:D-3-phosphoglycerate dehydrogenase
MSFSLVMGFEDSVLICDEVDPILNKILIDNGLKVSYENFDR